MSNCVRDQSFYRTYVQDSDILREIVRSEAVHWRLDRAKFIYFVVAGAISSSVYFEGSGEGSGNVMNVEI